MNPAITQLAAAVAAALDDPQFAAAVGHMRPVSRPPRTATLDVSGASAFLHLPVTTVRQYAREGRLPAFKAGRQWLFFADDLEDALRSNLLAA
jgi:excisionase family DNA binding protein